MDLKVAHVFTYFRSLGGVQSLLQYHHEQDREFGVDSDFVIYFESPAIPLPRVHFLGLSETASVRRTRAAVSSVAQQIKPGIRVYHAGWGMPFLADVDGAERRLLVVHAETPGIRGTIRDRGKWLDGVITISESLVALIEESIPRFPRDRIKQLPLPIKPPSSTPPRTLEARPLRIGFCGRLSVEQKRVDLLPAFAAELDKTTSNYELEFLGAGPDENLLTSAFSGRQNVRFHGRKSGEEYWNILSGWDCILFLSDYEGTPISLLEAMAVGVLPIYPLIKSGGERYVGAVNEQFIFPKGDVMAAAGVIKKIINARPLLRQEWRTRAIEAVQIHTGPAYMTQFSGFLKQLSEAPPIKSDMARIPPFPLDRLSFRQMAPLLKLKDRLRAWRHTGRKT